MGPSEVVAIALVAGGGLLLLWTGWKVLTGRVNAGAVDAQLVKLARANNLGRALKLCQAIEGTQLDAYAAALRAIPTDRRDRLSLEATMHPAFDEVARALATRWNARIQRGFLGAMLVVGGLGLWGSGRPLPPPAWVAGAMAGFIALFLLAQRTHMDRALANARANVLPVFVETVLDGASLPDTTAAPRPASTESGATPGPAAAGEPGIVLRIFDGDRFVREQCLTTTVVKLGSLDHATVHLGGDDQVSRMHAVIENEPGASTLIDLGSSSGTYVNGEKVAKANLHTGDTIQIGRYRLEVTVGFPATPAASPPAAVAPAATSPKPRASPPKTPGPSLKEGTCPVCGGTAIRKLDRGDARFQTLVCSSCGLVQEFADLSQLPS